MLCHCLIPICRLALTCLLCTDVCLWLAYEVSYGIYHQDEGQEWVLPVASGADCLPCCRRFGTPLQTCCESWDAPEFIEHEAWSRGVASLLCTLVQALFRTVGNAETSCQGTGDGFTCHLLIEWSGPGHLEGWDYPR